MWLVVLILFMVAEVIGNNLAKADFGADLLALCGLYVDVITSTYWNIEALTGLSGKAAYNRFRLTATGCSIFYASRRVVVD